MPLQPRLHLDIGWGDIASIFMPLTQSRAELIARIEAAWPANSVPALSVRTALDAMLTSLALPKGAAVAMSAVTIQNMADVVRAHGLEPVPVDLDIATLAPPAAQIDHAVATTGAQVYIHAHLYGSRNDLSEIAAVCHARGVVLIEDCAQGYTGVPPALPPLADISLYSFGPIKAQTCLGGAVAVCRTAETASAIRAVLEANAPMPEAWLRTRALKYAALKLLSSPLLYGFAFDVLRARGIDPDKAIGGTARGFSGADLMSALRRSPSRTLLRLLARRTANAAEDAWRARAGALLDAELDGAFERAGAAAQTQAFWLYAVLIDDPVAAMATMRAAGFDATRGATSLRAITEGTNVATPEAARLIEKVVYLPIAPSMSESTLRRMAQVLRDNVRPLRTIQEKVAA
ncbi:MAG: DegT/DnrJ/EryC1/StrS family aminotransferase [Hyphomonadaceae bacterium]